MYIVAPLNVAPTLNVATYVKCRKTSDKCRNPTLNVATPTYVKCRNAYVKCRKTSNLRYVSQHLR